MAEEWIDLPCDTPTTLFDVTGMGPVAAVKAVVDGLPQSPEEREAVWRKARIAAVMGNCAKTKESFKSGRALVQGCILSRISCMCPAGVKSWISFAKMRYGREEHLLPPSLDGLLEWSNLLRCLGTFSNYVGHVRTACIAHGLEMPQASHPALQRAKGAIVKRMLFTKRCAFRVHICCTACGFPCPPGLGCFCSAHMCGTCS